MEIDELRKYLGMEIGVVLEDGLVVEMSPLPVSDLPLLFKLAKKLEGKSSAEIDKEAIADMVSLIKASLAPKYKEDNEIFDALVRKYFFPLFNGVVETNNLGTTKARPVIERIRKLEARDAASVDAEEK